MGKKKRDKRGDGDRNGLAKKLAENKGQNRLDKLSYSKRDPSLRYRAKH